MEVGYTLTFRSWPIQIYGESARCSRICEEWQEHSKASGNFDLRHYFDASANSCPVYNNIRNAH
jgi:hypothetical protein